MRSNDLLWEDHGKYGRTRKAPLDPKLLAAETLFEDFQAQKSYKFGSADSFGIIFFFLADCGFWSMIQVGFYAHQTFLQRD